MSNKIQDARRVMRDAFAEDGPGPGTFRHAYQANIAMMIYDRFLEFDLAMSPNDLLEECNDVADIIIKVAFESGVEEDDTAEVSETACVNGGPSKSFVDGLMFETAKSAQYQLDHHFAGYTINEVSIGHVIRTPDGLVHATIGHDGLVAFNETKVEPLPIDDAFEKARP